MLLDLNRFETGRVSSRDDDGIMMAIVEYVDRMVRQQPLVLVLDDLHLADQRSVDTLRFVAKRLGHQPLVILAAWQQSLSPPDNPRGLRELAALPQALRLGLDGLDTFSVGAVAAEAGLQLEPADAAEIKELTGGNPSFVRELIEAERQGLSRNSQTAQPLQEAVVGQIGRLGDHAHWVLAVAASFDGSFLS